MSTDDPTGLEILRRLKSTDAPQWLAPNPSLSQQARTASCSLFSSLKPYSPQSPLDQLLIDGFDAEQIWQQIELLSQPLLSRLKREVRRFEKNPREISRILGAKLVRKDIRREAEDGVGREEEGVDGFDDVEGDLGGFDGVEGDLGGFDEDQAGESEELEEDDGAEEEEEEDGEDEGESDEGDKGGIEDGFLKIKELEEYLQKDEAREYGLEGAGRKKAGNKERRGIDEDDAEEEGEEDDGDDDELGGFGLDEEDEEEDDDDEMENARYQILQKMMYLSHFNFLSLVT